MKALRLPVLSRSNHLAADFANMQALQSKYIEKGCYDDQLWQWVAEAVTQKGSEKKPRVS